MQSDATATTPSSAPQPLTPASAPSPFLHAAHDYTAEELLLVHIADRLEVMAERMVEAGHSRIALFGSREHAIWAWQRIEALSTLPIVAFIDRPDRPGERRDIGVPVFQIDDPRVADTADTVLVMDDRCERALRDLAERHLPPGVLVFTVYDRLAIGGEPLAPDTDRRCEAVAASEAEAKPKPARSDEIELIDAGERRLGRLTAAAVPIR